MNTRKLLVVSGANGAVGSRVVSLASSRSDWVVMGIGRQPEPIYLESYQAPRSQYFSFDLSNQKLSDAIRAELTREDIDSILWVHAVGAFRDYENFNAEKLGNLDTLIQANFLTAMHALHFWLNYSISKRSGRFIAYSSVTAPRNFPFSAAFNASKMALESLVASVSNEILIPEITANCIALPTVATPAELALKPTADHAHWLDPSIVAQITIDRLDDQLGKYLRGATIPFYDPSVTFHGDSVAARYGKNYDAFVR